MESNLKANIDTKEILKEVDNIYGAEKCKDVLKNYISYVKMRKEGKIKYGNYNVYITNKSEADSANKIVEIIAKILQKEETIKGSYRYLERDEVTRGKVKEKSEDEDEEIDKDKNEQLLIIDSRKLNLPIRFWIEEIKEVMEKRTDKIFVIIGDQIKDDYTKSNLGDLTTWSLETEKVSKKNKIHYINTFLNDNEMKIDSKNSFVDVLSEEPFWKVKNELINILLECKIKNINCINDKTIKDKLKKDYCKKSKEKGEKKTSSLEELNSMVGMELVKQQINQIVNYIKINKKRGKMPTLHMCFLENPGTGKTTVARIVGKIFAEMNILSDKEVFVEAQRSDLIGKYVGHTAPQTQEMVERASGGVLFIDEAYSIASYIQDEAGRDFGAECIATLIKEMEDKRDSLCVILAGYSKEMEQMLSVNPGFESRIQFKIYFPDYSEEELYEIFKGMAKDENYKLATNLKDVLLDYFAREKQSENFANARCVRNLFEKVKFEQADRLVKDKEKDINLIKRCDVENVVLKIKPQEKPKRRIGFAS